MMNRQQLLQNIGSGTYLCQQLPFNYDILTWKKVAFWPFPRCCRLPVELKENFQGVD
jgi:hypothetical protein